MIIQGTGGFGKIEVSTIPMPDADMQMTGAQQGEMKMRATYAGVTLRIEDLVP